MPAQTVIKVRRDTAANWISADPTLASGEIGFETDTNQLKIGNGSLAWTALDYTSGGASVEISETAPASPDEGNVWFNSTDGRAYIYYDSTWVDLNPGIAGPAGPTGPAGAAGAPGPGILASATAPEDTTLVWYNTENGNAYTYYDGFWTSISGISIPAGGTTNQVLAKSSNTDYATEWVAPSALTLIKAQAIGTAVNSIVVTNAFSTDYENYKVVVSGGTPTAAVTMSIQMGTAATGYYGGSIRVTQASVSSAEGQSNATAYEIGRGFTGTNQPAMSMDILSPFTATRTAFFVSSVNADTSAAGGARWNNGYLNDTNSYTAFTLSYTGTITGGTVYVYGYRKA